MKKTIIIAFFSLLSATMLRAQTDVNSQFTIHNSQLSGDTLQSNSPLSGWRGAGGEALSTRLDSLIKNSTLLETSQLGLMVWDLTADSALYAYNHRQRMRPASTMKLLTAITALDLYGGNHPFTTEIRYEGRLSGRTFTGNIVCVGGMDPAFNSGDMHYVVDRIRESGIDTIFGRIVADKSMKDTLTLGQGWCWDDDNPCLSALLIDRKDRFADRLMKELRDVGVIFMDEGRWTKEDSSPITHHPSPITQPPTFNLQHSFDQILSRMMKQSDNLYAEAVFYHAALATSRPATQKNARAAVRQLIQKLGYDASQYTVADGSGLSLYNYLSPELLTAFLRYAWRNERIFLHLEPSLPVAGVDGTLKDRMKKSAAYRNVRAKTGTVTGISSLAGYATAPNGHRLAFAIINQGVLKGKEGRDFQDAVCTLLCNP
ncbi:MAG: D-alanyl-D-alanine carboxypeptidase/D-alanyl-D-alanine-endopeptidase [Prevotella sp.]|nr:D-alanyl-D-alanine carboxypeptidase/D-alanyl-D-alanine-endopeptidase [Prevotella sp.]